MIGFVDVPGHERFVRNMLAGVCGIDYVMLIVAADDGVMPQTVEHLHIVDLLTIKHGIAVITKTDRVPAERVAEVAASVRALLAPTALAAIEVLPVSAISGDGIDKLRDVLAQCRARARRPRARGTQFALRDRPRVHHRRQRHRRYRHRIQRRRRDRRQVDALAQRHRGARARHPERRASREPGPSPASAAH